MQEMKEMTVRSLGWEDPLMKGMATHPSILGWRIPWTEEPGGYSSQVSNSQTWPKWLSTHSCYSPWFLSLAQSSLQNSCLVHPPSYSALPPRMSNRHLNVFKTESGEGWMCVSVCAECQGVGTRYSSHVSFLLARNVVANTFRAK